MSWPPESSKAPNCYCAGNGYAVGADQCRRSAWWLIRQLGNAYPDLGARAAPLGTGQHRPVARLWDWGDRECLPPFGDCRVRALIARCPSIALLPPTDRAICVAVAPDVVVFHPELVRDPDQPDAQHGQHD